MYKSHLMCGTCVRGICMSPTHVGYDILMHQQEGGIDLLGFMGAFAS